MSGSYPGGMKWTASLAQKGLCETQEAKMTPHGKATEQRPVQKKYILWDYV